MDDFNNDVLFIKSDLKNEVDFFLPLLEEKLNTPTFRSIKLKRKSEIRIIQSITRRNNPQGLLISEHSAERYNLKLNQYKSILKNYIDSSEVDKYCLKLACTCHIKAAISISNLILEHNQQSHWKTWLDWNSHENQISHWQTKLFTSPTINNEKDIRNYFNLYGVASKLINEARLQNPKKAQNQMGLKTPICFLVSAYILPYQILVGYVKIKNSIQKIEYLTQILRAIDNYWCGGITATKRKQWDFKKTAFDIKMESTKAKNRIKAKLSKDPKQIAKASIKELYLDWKISAPKRYLSNAEFARDMQKKFTDENEIEIIKSSKTITDVWIKEWENELKETP